MEREEARQRKAATPGGLGEWACEWLECTRCPLHRRRTNVVMGRGAIPASILLIGGVPDQRDDEEGYPFAGLSGHILNRAIRRELEPDSFYVTTTVACRPYRNNRESLRAEAAECSDRLTRIVTDIQPWVVILLGAQALLHIIGHKLHRRNTVIWDDHLLPCVVSHHPNTILETGDSLKMVELRQDLRKARVLAESQQDLLF